MHRCRSRSCIGWVYGIPSTTTSLDGASTGREGKNSKLEPGFTPAEPPPGQGLHHYHVQVFALDEEVWSAPTSGADPPSGHRGDAQAKRVPAVG